MASFNVVPSDLGVAGAKLSGISDEVTAVHAGLMQSSGAADDTAASGAFEDLLDRFSTVLPHYAAAGAAVSGNLHGAGNLYAKTDQDVSGELSPEQA